MGKSPSAVPAVPAGDGRQLAVGSWQRAVAKAEMRLRLGGDALAPRLSSSTGGRGATRAAEGFQEPLQPFPAYDLPAAGVGVAQDNGDGALNG